MSFSVAEVLRLVGAFGSIDHTVVCIAADDSCMFRQAVRAYAWLDA